MGQVELAPTRDFSTQGPSDRSSLHYGDYITLVSEVSALHYYTHFTINVDYVVSVICCLISDRTFWKVRTDVSVSIFS